MALNEEIKPLQIQPPANVEQYDQNQILSGLGTKPPEMPPDYQSYLKSTGNLAPVDFGGPTPQNAMHLEAVHKLKGTAGVNMAKGNIQTGDQLYGAMVKNNPDHNPNLSYEGSQLFQKELKTRLPAEWQAYQDRLASEKTAEQQGLTAEEVAFRSRLPPEGQMQYDQMKTQERLNQVFPPPPKEQQGQTAQAAPAAQQDPLTKAQQYERDNSVTVGPGAGWRTKAEWDAKDARNNTTTPDWVRNAIDYQEEQAARAVHGQAGATASNPQAQQIEQATAVINGMVRSGAITQKQAAAEIGRLQLDAIKANASQASRQDFRPKAMSLKLPDGRSVSMISKSDGTWSTAPDEKERLPDGESSLGGKIFFTKAGKTVEVNPTASARGNNGEWYPREVVKNPDTGDYEYGEPMFPEGVVEMKGALKKPEETAKTSPASTRPLNIGDIVKGYIYKGGDKSKPESWEKI